MIPLHIIGAGGHAKVVLDIIYQMANFDSLDISVYDDKFEEPHKMQVLNEFVCGKVDALYNSRFKGHSVFVAIGDNKRRMELINRVRTMPGLHPKTFLHPNSYVSPFAKIGAGSIVMPGAVIQTGAVIGEGCIINTGATVDHDCELGKGVHICPGAHLAGEVFVGDYTAIGTGAAVIPGIRIGRESIVGAGSVVIRDVWSGIQVVGNPAK